MSGGWAFLLGFLGASGAEFALHIFPRRFDVELPPWMTARAYWTIAAVGAGFGGLAALLYSLERPLEWYVAVNIGITWPLLFQQGFQRSPEPEATNVN